MADRVKVFEEKKNAMSIWAWLLPLLLLLALAAFFFTRHHDEPAAVSTAAPVAMTREPSPVTALPDLGTVHFDTDKASLTPDGQATLHKAAAAMKADPNVHLRLEGYTDSTGSSSHNDSLADQRARTVVDFLQGQGVERSRLTGEGFGAAKPVDTNATDQGKADNRRVELFSQQ